jgi:UDP-N-acetyl-D-mannosaminuronic acid dehydrogenase
VRELFGRFSSELVEMEPLEAELCKLMTNAWRYVQFATVNQFYMLATAHGVDFARILHGCRHNYPRMAGVPGPGLAAGPCLVKDTMQLAAFSHNNFMLGHAAMLVNEGMPAHLIELARRQTKIAGKVVGILGMAFKAESDDPRDSLSYKLRKLLSLEARRVLCTDPYVADETLVPLERVLAESELLFVATPHRAYRGLVPPPGALVVDIWSCLAARPEVAAEVAAEAAP